uniref:Uncharacterized protein n=1 Tax=Meloidogyne enterolobii TaxID=390850 RepID=A0A6V7VP01_MELEN|nr:unnamed protein product [Meloidogyne enterolobii]
MIQQIKNSISFLIPLMVFAIMAVLSVEGRKVPTGPNQEKSPGSGP